MFNIGTDFTASVEQSLREYPTNQGNLRSFSTVQTFFFYSVEAVVSIDSCDVAWLWVMFKSLCYSSFTGFMSHRSEFSRVVEEQSMSVCGIWQV